MNLEQIDTSTTAGKADGAKRYVVLKEVGSRYAYIQDTHQRRTVTRWGILRDRGWAKADKQCERLNAAHFAGEVMG